MAKQGGTAGAEANPESSRPLHHPADGPESGRSLSQSDLGLPGAVHPVSPRSGEDLGGGKRPGWRKGRFLVFDADAQALFLDRVRRGDHIKDAAAAAGVHHATARYRRANDPAFAAGWEAAVAASPRAVKRDRKGRWRIKSKGRPVKFDRESKQAFLDRFAGTCDFEASARAAGVSASTIHRHLASDPAFADGFDEAIAISHRLIEAEALRQVRAAQKKYRLSPDSDGAAASFERAMQLMRHYRRPNGGAGRPGPQRAQARARWTFEEAMTLLDTKLDAFEKNDRRRHPPPASAGAAPGGEEAAE